MKTTITLRWNLLYAMLLFNMISFGQYFDETYYLHNYSAEHFELRGVAQTGNGEYGAVVRRTAWGSGTLPYYTANFKIDANGDTLFTKATSDFYAGPWRVAHDNVNSRIITTKSHGLVAYDYNMDTVWTQTVSTTTVINNSVLALNNQYVLSGYEYATLPHAPYFAKFDLNGNELFYKEFNFESYHQQGVDVTENQQIPGGVVLLVNAPADFKLYATDTNGDTTWTKAYDKSIYGSPKRIINETSGGYLVLSQLGLNAVVSSIDALGAVNWSKIVAQNIWNTVDITEKDNHLYVLNEGAANNGNNQLAAAMCLSKSNNTGDTLWVKTYQSSTAGRYPAQILPSIYNDGVVIAGNDSVQPFGTTGIGVWRPFITAMDSSGTVDTCNGLEVTIHPTVTEDTLTAIISGGTQPYAPQYMWSNGATSQTISLGGWPGSYCVTVMDSVGCHADTCGYFNPAPDSVWPGDCDFNGVANIFDLLPIGFGYNQQGPIRNNATLNWVAQQANPYNSSYLNGVDYKHADCNGDGIVDLNDASAILLNYGLTHNKGENDPPTLLGVPTLSFQPSVDTVTVGSPVSIPIHLGDAQNSVDSIYGFIFNINIDTSLVKPGGSISYNPSWMGTLNTDLITLQREDLSNQIIINGMVRNDQLNQSGFGEIAQLNIVMQDDIAGKTYIFDTLNLSFSDVFAITFSGDTVSVNQSNQSIIVKQSTSTTGTESFVYDPFKVYPNPTQGSIWVDGPINKYDVLDARGTLLKSQEVGQQSNIKLELDLPNGLYFIRLNNHWTRKITIRN